MYEIAIQYYIHNIEPKLNLAYLHNPDKSKKLTASNFQYKNLHRPSL